MANKRTGRPAHRGQRRRVPRQRPNWRLRAGLTAVAVVTILVGWAAIARKVAPTGNTTQKRFDALIVLGSRANADGNPTPTMLARVTEAVQEYERGVAPRLILTGGAAHNSFVEAAVMERTAEAQGIPASAIVMEPEAKNTIQNACYAARIMQAHGWTSAEIVSSATQLPRAGIIFSRLPLEWHVHAAPAPEPDAGGDSAEKEVLKTLYYLVWSRQMDRCQP